MLLPPYAADRQGLSGQALTLVPLTAAFVSDGQSEVLSICLNFPGSTCKKVGFSKQPI